MRVLVESGNGAINILYLFLEYAQGRPRPVEFSRRRMMIEEEDLHEEQVIDDIS